MAIFGDFFVSCISIERQLTSVVSLYVSLCVSLYVLLYVSLYVLLSVCVEEERVGVQVSDDVCV